MEHWLSFYLQHFASQKEAEDFVQKCECLQPSAPNFVALIMMHQTQRLLSIVDDLPKFRYDVEPLQILFLLMCSENIAKLHDGFRGEGKSRHYIHKFFNQFLSQSDKDTLSYGFIVNDDTSPSIRFKEAVDLLYDIRCDVVHEGNYTNFVFHDGKEPKVNTNPDVIAEIQLLDIRDIVVRGCIYAINDKLSNV